MNDLESYFRNNDKRLINKFYHYFDVYERHFKKFRNQEITVLEIGVFKGGSLQMWKEYFGPRAKIYGVDIDPECKKYEEDGIEIIIGSQTDRTFLRELKEKIPHLDILIDDGGHTMRQQIITFEELYDHIDTNGVYLCEDLHTSYFLEYGGGHRRNGTFIEFSKQLVDKLNAYLSEENSLRPDSFTLSTNSVHFYTSMVVIEKGVNPKPESAKTGISNDTETPNVQNSRRNWKYHVLFIINKVLRYFKIRGFRWR